MENPRPSRHCVHLGPRLQRRATEGSPGVAAAGGQRGGCGGAGAGAAGDLGRPGCWR